MEPQAWTHHGTRANTSKLLLAPPEDVIPRKHDQPSCSCKPLPEGMDGHTVSGDMHNPIQDDLNPETLTADAEPENSQPLISQPILLHNGSRAAAEPRNEHRGAQACEGGNSAPLSGLYLSHFLSTWNARTYEFAAVVFTVEAFPNTLLPASISGISQCLAAILFSPSVGAWADRNPSRLASLKTTILAQRIAVFVACVCWMVLLWSSDTASSPYAVGAKLGVLAVIVILSCIERLAAGGNVVIMERDWVPTLAPAVGESSLHVLNATMRRIDLICKVLAPGFVTLLPAGFSAIPATKRHPVFWTVVVIAIMSLLSPWVEWFSAQRVWNKNELLQASKIMEPEPEEEFEDNNTGGVSQYLQGKISGLARFCQSAVFLPTISISLMYLSVLTFSSPMITFLLNAGFTLPVVTTARLFSSLLEVSATAVMPWGVKTLRDRPVKHWRRVNEDEIGFLEEYLPAPETTSIDKAEVERVGLWAVWWMTISLMPAVYGVVGLTSTPNTSPPGLPSPYFSIPMLIGVAFSRIGLWTYDLAYSQLQQTLPPPSLRGEFTGIEQSFLSTAELLQWTLTATLSRPKDFGTLAIVSWVSILGAAGCYAWFIRKRRGHLLHVKVSGCCKS